MQLKTIRKNKKISQIQLSKELHVSNTTISMWETGKCKPTINKVFAIAKALNVSEQEIFNCFKDE